jgi:hypothetical protein
MKIRLRDLHNETFALEELQCCGGGVQPLGVYPSNSLPALLSEYNLQAAAQGKTVFEASKNKVLAFLNLTPRLDHG